MRRQLNQTWHNGDEVAAARFNRDGSLDATFGVGGSEGDGKVIISLPGRSYATGVAVAPRGQVQLSIGMDSYLGGAFSAARLTADGTVDPTYGRGGADGDGVASADFGPAGGNGAALAVFADGRALVAGSAGGNFALARFAADGPGPDRDGNDQTFEATRLRVGGTWDQAISGRTDVDLYRFAATTGQRVGFDVDAGAGSTFDSYLRVFAADGTELLANDNGAAPGEALGSSAYAEFTFSAGGTYYVAVSSAGNRTYDPVTGTGDAAGGSTSGASGTFTLTLTDRTPRPHADGDDQLSEAPID